MKTNTEKLDSEPGIASTIFGLAVVRKAIIPHGTPRSEQVDKWAVIFPNKPTRWFDTSAKAYAAARRFNNRSRS